MPSISTSAFPAALQPSSIILPHPYPHHCANINTHTTLLSPSTNMSARLGFRASQAFRQNFQSQLRFNTQRRFQSTTAQTAESGQGYFTKLWNSEVGPKTVHFWAPIAKVSARLCQHRPITDSTNALAHSGESS